MPLSLVARINELAKKARLKGLTPEEEQEQDRLRAQYLHEFRLQFELLVKKTQLGNQGTPSNPPRTEH